MKTDALLNIYRHMVLAREVDRVEQLLINQGEAFFHVSCAGHEGSVALAPHLSADDWLHCHYRDKALMLARGISAEMFLLSSLCRGTSHSNGRQMSAHMSAPELNIFSIVGPVGNNALHAAGVAATVRDKLGAPIVLCALGDGTTQQGEVYEALAESVRSSLPVLFFVHDNKLAISTKTRYRTFFSMPDDSTPDAFHGIPVVTLNGRDPLACIEPLGEIVSRMRRDRKPSIVVFQVERLSSHTNADDHTVYRSEEEIRISWTSSDPVSRTRSQLLDSGVPEHILKTIENKARDEVEAARIQARHAPEPEPCFTAKKSLLPKFSSSSSEYLGTPENRTLTMLEAIRGVLRQRLDDDPAVLLYGEDLEDPKGDVFGVTRGLSRDYPNQVYNSPLAESTIVGTCIGRALAGTRPVAFLQFADFLPIAYNQLVSEMGSMYWRTDGGWQAPVIVMAACGGFKPGLGPFHAQTFESTAAHIPGVDVFMPSTAADAAGLLNAAFESGRPTIFFYPKNLLNDRTRMTSGDIAAHFVPIGRARRMHTGRDITLVCWGNTTVQCMKVAETLAIEGINADVLDLRSIFPWDEEMVLESVQQTGRLIVVHEDNHTCGLGAEILATIAEKASLPVRMRRITRPDTYVPCNFANQLEVLPSYQRVLEAAADLLDFDISWKAPASVEDGLYIVNAMGSSPADESITIADLMVQEGDYVKTGATLAEVDADKASAELASPVAGCVTEILAREGETLKVGEPFLHIRVDDGDGVRKPIVAELHGEPVFIRRAVSKQDNAVVHVPSSSRRTHRVGLGATGVAPGSRIVHTQDLVAGFTGLEHDDLIRRTGIHSRPWVADDETILTLALRASETALEKNNISLHEINTIFCATGTPPASSPTLACQILRDLSERHGAHTAQAVDMNAACSGYLAVLQAAYDYLQNRPGDVVLLVTAEVLSPRLDPTDYSTAALFADAATATILYGEDRMNTVTALVHRPVLSAEADATNALYVPLSASNGEYVHMNGARVYAMAVRRMAAMLKQACRHEDLSLADLSLVVPHQANQRIIDAVASRLGLQPERVYSNIQRMGNTSSCTIPIALSEVLPYQQAGAQIGLCAFGGGFTYGAGILTVVQ